MWLVVQYKNGCSPAVVAVFARCCQAMERTAELSAESPLDRFYPRLESNFSIRRSINGIASSGDWKKNKPKKPKKSKSNRFGLILKHKEVVSGY